MYSLQNSIHSVDETRVSWDSRTCLDRPKLGVNSAIAHQWVFFDTGIDQGQDDSNGHACRRSNAHDGDVIESSRKRDEN